MLYRSTALIFALAIASAFSAGQEPRFTGSSLKAAVRSAATPTDFTRLSAYFDERAKYYHGLYKEQEKILRLELEHPGRGSKYPNAAEHARRFEEYYAQQSHAAHEQSEHFKLLATKAAAR